MRSAEKKYPHDFLITITLQVRSYKCGSTGHCSLIYVQLVKM